MEKHKCPIVDGLRYEGGALMEAAANEIERLRLELHAALDECSATKRHRDSLAQSYREMREILIQNHLIAGSRPEIE